MSNLLTKSRLSAARQCQRLHDIVYLKGYRPAEEAKPLSFGTLTHTGLEAIWQRKQMELAGDPFDLARVRPMLAGYAARWNLDEWDVLSVEQRFECPLVNPETGAESKTWKLAGKFDAIVREKSTGRVMIVEHKTSSQDISRGSAYWARLSMDSQVSIYFAGARSLGYDVSAVLYDVLKKPSLRPYEPGKKRQVAETAEEFEARCFEAIAEEPDKYYVRGEVVRLDSEMDDAMTDVWQSAQQIREAERLGRSPRNPDACEKWGRLCSFFPVCSGAETLENERMYKRSEEVHPELALPVPSSKEESHDRSTEPSSAAAQ